MIVAIDGPAGSGKSTVARALAAREGLTYLDTGAMYRAVTCAALARGVSASDADAVAELARTLPLSLTTGASGQQVLVDGEDRTAEIRTPEVDANVSAVAANPAVREAMVSLQRKLAEGANVVAEGRDIGTVVFPAAEVKVFLTADPAARAHRRAVQRAGGDTATGKAAATDAAQERAVEDELIARDKADSSRAASPLRPADDARHLDSTGLSVDEVCDLIVGLMREVRS